MIEAMEMLIRSRQHNTFALPLKRGIFRNLRLMCLHYWREILYRQGKELLQIAADAGDALALQSLQEMKQDESKVD
jgi:hypothetical protein